MNILPKAIREGYLSPIKAMTIPLQLDRPGYPVQSGDFKAGDIATALDPYLHQIADEMMKYMQGPKDGRVPSTGKDQPEVQRDPE